MSKIYSSISKEGRKAASMVVDIRLAKFNDQEIEVFTDNGIDYVALSSICKNMGISWPRQRKKLMEDETLSKVIKKKYRLVGGKSRQIICIPFDKLAGWFFHINENKVKKKIKEHVILYKKECYKVLDDYFKQGYALNEKILMDKPQNKEKLVKELSSLNTSDSVLEVGNERYIFITAERTDGVKVLMHDLKSLFGVLISSEKLSGETIRKKLSKMYPQGHDLRVTEGLDNKKGQKPIIIKPEGIVKFLEVNPFLTAPQDLLIQLIEKMNRYVEERKKKGEAVYPLGFGDSLVTTVDIVFKYLLQNEGDRMSEDFSLFLNSSNIVYIIQLQNENYYIGALAEQTFKERFNNHDVVRKKSFKNFFALFKVVNKKTNSFVVEAELHHIVSQLTGNKLSSIKSAGGETGFRAKPNNIVQALFLSENLRNHCELVGPEITEKATEWLYAGPTKEVIAFPVRH